MNHGKAAHIQGEHPGSARYNPDQSDEERNGLGNLMFVCQDHHDIIDNGENEHRYPTEQLLEWKAQHESAHAAASEAALTGIGFEELATATEWVRTAPLQAEDADLRVIPPREKIVRNELSNQAANVIAGALLNARLVSAFVEDTALDDPDFPERLKSGFLAEYHRLRQQGTRGDELFELMCAFAQRGMRSQAQRSAGLTVLVYLFEKCDVFEKEAS